MNKSIIFFSNTLIISCLIRSMWQSLHIYWKWRTYCVVQFFPFRFRCCSNVSPGLEIWLRWIFTRGVAMHRSCLGWAGYIFFCRYFPTPSSSLCWCSRGCWLHRSPCWSWCLDRYWKTMWSKFIFWSLTAKGSLTFFSGLCCNISSVREVQEKRQQLCAPEYLILLVQNEFCHSA